MDKINEIGVRRCLLMEGWWSKCLQKKVADYIAIEGWGAIHSMFSIKCGWCLRSNQKLNS